MQYSLEFAKFWDYIFLETKNFKPALIILKKKNLKNNVKLKYQQKLMDKIYAWNKINAKYKDYIGCICFDHI